MKLSYDVRGQPRPRSATHEQANLIADGVHCETDFICYTVDAPERPRAVEARSERSSFTWRPERTRRPPGGRKAVWSLGPGADAEIVMYRLKGADT